MNRLRRRFRNCWQCLECRGDRRLFRRFLLSPYYDDYVLWLWLWERKQRQLHRCDNMYLASGGPTKIVDVRVRLSMSIEDTSVQKLHFISILCAGNRLKNRTPDLAFGGFIRSSLCDMWWRFNFKWRNWFSPTFLTLNPFHVTQSKRCRDNCNILRYTTYIYVYLLT